MIGKTLGRYIFFHYLKISCYLLAIVGLLCFLIDLTQTASRLGAMPHYSVEYSLIISSLRAPFLLLQTIPFISLLASLIVFFLQHKYLELVIIRAAGLSAWQFLFPMCVGALLLGLFGIFILNPLGAYGLNKANNLVVKWRSANFAIPTNKPYSPWLVQKTANGGETSIGIKAIDRQVDYNTILTLLNNLPPSADLELAQKALKQTLKNQHEKHGYVVLLDATFMTLSKKNNSLPSPSWYYTSKAILLPGYWVLINPVAYSVSSIARFPSIITIETAIQQKALEEYIKDPNTIPVYELNDKIKTTKSFGYSTYPLRMILNTLIALPMLSITMVLIAAMVTLRFSRLLNIKLYLLVGLLAGFALYIALVLAQDFGKLGLISPIVAAWFPICIALFTGLSFILQREDG